MQEIGMLRAEIIVTLSSGLGAATIHAVKYNDLDFAVSEFERVADLLKKRADRGNEFPRFLDLEGMSKFSCKFDSIAAVSLMDYKKEDVGMIGVKDEYPHLSWKNV
jgi:hypothetical protein